MQIVKFKKMSGSRYKVFFLDGSDIVVHEDIVLKYNMVTNKSIDSNMLDTILRDNNKYMVYDIVLKYIKIKLRCENEIIDYLKKKNIEDDLINEIIGRLKDDGYLDSKNYIKSYVNDRFNINNIGPVKIKRELISLGFEDKDIEEEINKINKDELLIKLNKLIDKKIIQTKNYSGYVLRKKIFDYFIDKGFESFDIESILKNKILSDDEQLKREYNKLYNKYSKKYSGKELELLIKQKLYKKGFYYNEI